MNIKEACLKFEINFDKIECFVQKGLIGNLEGNAQITDDDIAKIGLILLYEKAGICNDDILVCLDSTSRKQKVVQILKRARQRLLNEVHENQKMIDKFDFLLRGYN